MAKYKLQQYGILDTENGALIPEDESNRDWQDYQSWLLEGNTPDPFMTDQELIDEAKRIKLAAIENKKNELMDMGVEYPANSGKFISIGKESTDNILGSTQRAQLAQSFGWPNDFYWQYLDGTYLYIATAQEMIIFGEAVFTESRRLIKIAREKSEAVKALNDLSSINSFDAEGGWDA